MRIEYKLVENDLVGAQEGRHVGMWAKFMPILGLLLIAPGVISPATNPKHDSASALPILGFLLFGLRVLVRRSYRRDNRLHHNLEAVISDSGIDLSSPIGSSKYTG